ncbi:MAG: GNAT family N-acetyltransferase, partial [Pseudomonadota bacterium]
MDLPHSDALRDAVDATWPPADVVTIPGWRLRVGAGGGKRVSSASAEGAPGDIAAAEAGMATLNQPPLFRLEGAEHDLDAALEARGYLLVDPVACLVGPTERLQPPHRDRVLYCDAPLATHLELW